MPKRPLSDCESYPPLQSKIHVSNREINQGICAETNMKAVYNRTLSLLFQGSKINNSMIKQEGENSTMPSPIPTAQHSKFSQMILTANGQIHTDTKGHAMKGMADQATPFTCRSCCSVDFHSLERCKFCEGLFCESCCRPCSMCQLEFCSKCSMNIYEDNSLCFSCATEKGPAL